jgi:hypothetical protein
VVDEFAGESLSLEIEFGIQRDMRTFRKAVLLTPLLFATAIVPAFAQQHHNDSAYYNGMRHGAQGGNYYNNHDRPYHNDHYQQPKQGGIGPGKGALIGGAGGAALGAIFGGGLKGTLIGGAAGAGIGAVVGQAAQNKRNNNNNYHHPY